MRRELFVGNLAFSITDESLRGLFSEAGTVESAKVITDRATGKSRGFGFVTMDSVEAATKAIEKLNNRDTDGRPLRVNFSNSENQPSSGGSRPPRTGGGGGGFRSNDGGGYRGNDGGSRGRDGNSGSYNRDRGSSSYNR